MDRFLVSRIRDLLHELGKVLGGHILLEKLKQILLARESFVVHPAGLHKHVYFLSFGLAFFLPRSVSMKSS